MHANHIWDVTLIGISIFLMIALCRIKLLLQFRDALVFKIDYINDGD